MAAMPFLILIVLSHFLLLHSAEEQGRTYHRPHCPAFPCGKLGDIRFPYTQSGRPDCGLFAVDGCKDINQSIQLEQGGRWYQLNAISQANTITIHDEGLEKHMRNKDCQSLKNLSFPNLPYVTFEVISSLTLCKCNSPVNTSFATEFGYRVCKDYTIYYSEPEENSKPPENHKNDRLSSLCNCPIIQLPFTDHPPKKILQHNNHFFKLLTPNVHVQVHVSVDCWRCHFRGGRCIANKQRFHCSKGKNKFGPKLGLGISLSCIQVINSFSASSIAGIVLFIILAFCFIRKLSWEGSMFIWKMKTEKNKNIEAFLKDYEFLAPKRYRYSDIKKITNLFQDKLGKGGYGDVYKGKLFDERDVAVKILNKSKK